jgi:insulysin
MSDAFVLDKILKPVNDRRKYDKLTLQNGLRIIVISDPDATVSTAALSVNVGSLQNKYVPTENGEYTEVHGIAHFLEHMLFMGSEKYPDETIYTKLITKYGGMSNAYTDMNTTCYYFSVTEEFEQMLDIFANFFIRPSLNKSAIDREMQAVQEEHNKNYYDDNWRELQLMRHISTKDSMWNGFATGTIKSLDIANIDKLLSNFFHAYYRPDNMNLVLLSRDPVDQLIKMATSTFSPIMARPSLSILTTGWPYEKHKVALMSSIHTKNSMSITWQIPNFRLYFIQYRYYGLIHFISHVMKCRSTGSLFDVLKKQNYATGLDVEPIQYVGDVFLFSIQISLTYDGLLHKDEIIDTVYRYVALFRESCLAYLDGIKIIYQQLQLVKKQSVLYGDSEGKNDPLEFVKNLAETMSIYRTSVSLSEMLVVGKLLRDYSYEVNSMVVDILNYFRLDNSVVLFVSKSYEGLLKELEPWYGIEYDVCSPDTKFRIFPSSSHTNLLLPGKNKYIVEQSRIIPGISQKYPVRVNSFSGYELWYQFVNQFNDPYVMFTIRFTLPKLGTSILWYLSFKIYIECVVDIMSDELYQAIEANIEPMLSIGQKDVSISVIGHLEKLKSLLSIFVDNLLNPDRLDIATFSRIRKKTHESLVNGIFIAPYESVMRKLFYDTGTILYTTADMLHHIMDVTYNDVVNIFRTMFSQSTVKGIIVGNIRLRDAENLATVYKPLLVDTVRLELRENIADTSGKIIKSLPDNSKEFNSAAGVFYRLGRIRPMATYSNVFDLNSWNYITCLSNLVDSIIKHVFIDKLRTNEQLGYIVNSDLIVLDSDYNPLLCYGFIVQSSTKDSHYLSSRIDSFVRDARITIMDESNDDLNVRKKSLIKLLLRHPNSLRELAKRSLNKAFNTDNVMDMENILVNTYQSITAKHLLEFYDYYFNNTMTRSTWIVEIGSVK